MKMLQELLAVDDKPCLRICFRSVHKKVFSEGKFVSTVPKVNQFKSTYCKEHYETQPVSLRSTKIVLYKP